MREFRGRLFPVILLMSLFLVPFRVMAHAASLQRVQLATAEADSATIAVNQTGAMHRVKPENHELERPRMVLSENMFLVPERVTIGANVQVSSVDKDGVLYAMRFKEILKSDDGGTTWTRVWCIPDDEPRFPASVQCLDNGALMVVLGSNRDTGEPDGCVYLSGTNGSDFTKVLSTSRGCVGVSYGSFMHGSFVLLSEYGAKLPGVDSPRRAYLSKDYGVTWHTILTLEKHINVHTHNVVMDEFSGRIWVTVGDQPPEQNAYFTDDFGQTWLSLWESGECPMNPLSIACFEDCVLIGSDSVDELTFWRYDKHTENVEKVYKLDTPGSLQVTLSSVMVPIDRDDYIAVIPTHSDPAKTDNSMMLATNGTTFGILWMQQDKTCNAERVLRIAGVHENALYVQPVALGTMLRFTLPREWKKH